MAKILCICGWFDKYEPNHTVDRKEFVASHGIDMDTGRTIILQCVHPRELGAKQDANGEWFIEN